ncbi:hypothetical protein SH1V18_18630 [Vallitalea longa]|uniref:Uncharacterized protein n=1 Tax=Vallitalea longa TaxID=2936439 RepID=A0A9W5YDT4_9FIRM|nr:hypothetical protein [Vallitalea longa]GKX29383.1 hypothetical protein SH1V18_18630 [Vallitalea longa]
MKKYNEKLLVDFISIVFCFVVFSLLLGIDSLIAFVPVIAGILFVVLLIKFLELFF